MASRTIQIEIEADRLAALDAAASRSHLDRETLIERVLDSYLASDSFYRERVEAGLRDIENGDTVSHQEVVAELEDLFARPFPNAR